MTPERLEVHRLIGQNEDLEFAFNWIVWSGELYRKDSVKAKEHQITWPGIEEWCAIDITFASESFADTPLAAILALKKMHDDYEQYCSQHPLASS